MAPIPPMLIRLATAFLTQALTRRLQQSPMFFRAVDRLIHEIDHFPHRMQGNPKPYRRIDPQEPTLGEWAQDSWNHRVDDPGEPHDLPNPYADPSSTSSHSASSPSSATPGQMSRERARQSAQDGQRNAQQARDRRKAEDEQAKKDEKMDEMRLVLERLREARDQQKP